MSTKKKRLWLAVAVLNIVATVTFAPVGAHAQDIGSQQQPLKEANEADTDEYPFAVLVESPNALCSGSLIDQWFVLTAAHCVVGNNETEDEIDITIGRAQLSDRQNGEERKVSKIIAHPYYDPNTANNDVALLQLDRPSTKTPVKIADSNDRSYWKKGTTATMIGYGETTWKGSLPNRLMEAETTIVSDKSSDMKIKVKDPKTGACRGDSGSPLLVKEGRKWLQVGVASTSTADTCSPSYYMNVAQSGPFYNWVLRNIKEQPIGTAYTSTYDPLGKTYDYLSSTPIGTSAKTTRTWIGTYNVEFPGLRVNQQNPPVAVVTSNSRGTYCKFGSDPLYGKKVVCFDSNGRLTNSEFSFYTSDQEKDYHLAVPKLTATTTLRNGSGTVKVQRNRAGNYWVVPQNWKGKNWRNAIVTAVGSGDVRCHTQWLGRGSATIKCVDSNGVEKDSAFNIVASTNETDASFVFSDKPEGKVFPGYAKSIASSSTPTIERRATGKYTVKLPGITSKGGGNVQATAYGITTNACNAVYWWGDYALVECLDKNGRYADTAFMLRHYDPRNVSRTIRLSVESLVATSSDSCGGMDMYGTLSSGTEKVKIPQVNDKDARNFSQIIDLRDGANKSEIHIEKPTNPGDSYVDFTVKVVDDDDFFCGGSDDTVDIFAQKSRKQLDLRLDLQTNKILDSATNVELGTIGLEKFQGYNGDETGLATIKVVDTTR